MAPKDKLDLTFKLDPVQIAQLEKAMAQLGKFSGAAMGMGKAKDAADALAFAFATAGKYSKPPFSGTVNLSEAPVDSKTLKELMSKAVEAPVGHKIKAERLKIVSDGTPQGTTILTESGIPINGCTELTLNISAEGESTCVMFFNHVSFEIDAKSDIFEVVVSDS